MPPRQVVESSVPPPQVLEPHVPSVEASEPPTPPSEATLAPTGGIVLPTVALEAIFLPVVAMEAPSWRSSRTPSDHECRMGDLRPRMLEKRQPPPWILGPMWRPCPMGPRYQKHRRSVPWWWWRRRGQGSAGPWPKFKRGHRGPRCWSLVELRALSPLHRWWPLAPCIVC